MSHIRKRGSIAKMIYFTEGYVYYKLSRNQIIYGTNIEVGKAAG
jgi:predicted transcriptional regulator